jgi:hypothetical protein
MRKIFIHILFLIKFLNEIKIRTHVTSPPMTAVSRVDFRLHTPIVNGEMNNATAVDNAPSQPEVGKKERKINRI